MLRILKCLRIARPILRYQCLELHTASVSRYSDRQYKVQVRDTCPPDPPPPPPKPKDESLFWGAMAMLCVAAGFTVIAKNSPELRDWLTIHAPWFDDIIAIVYEENMTYEEFAKKCMDELKALPKLIMKTEPPCPAEEVPEPAKDVITVPTKSEIEAKQEPEKPPECETPPPVVTRKTVCEIVDRLKERSNEAMSNYYTANRACLLYNQIVTETMQDFSIPTLKELNGHMEERLHLVTSSLRKAEAATADIEELTRYIECEVQGPTDEVENTKTLMKDFLEKIKAARIQYIWENDKSIVLDTQWQKVAHIIDKYSDENEAMYPEIKYALSKLQLVGDADLLLCHTSKYARQLATELGDAVAGMTERVDRAFETLPQEEQEKKQRDAMLRAVLKQKRAEMDKEYRTRYEDQRLANDKTLKDSLRKQLERHQETMDKRLKEKEKETTIKLNKMVAEKVAHEKRLFAKQLDEMTVKLAIVQDKLNARLKAERETRRSQELWVASASLLRATKDGEPYVNVNKELKAIEKASGDGDKLVTTVLNAIPGSVREKGVVPESVLREKYHQMERVALKVALVERDGAPLPIYLLSWLQSTLLFMKLPGIPQAEIENPPKEPFKDLDTFDLLQRARFWVERGNLATAIRYVDSLEGASRAAASTWHDAARSHVETRQAAEAILAHAAALGIQYI